MSAYERGERAGRHEAELFTDRSEPGEYAIISEFEIMTDTGALVKLDEPEYRAGFIAGYQAVRGGLQRARTAGRAHATWRTESGMNPSMRQAEIRRALKDAYMHEPTDAECEVFEEAFAARYAALVEMASGE
jgi:hypothetical protein